MSRLAHFRFKKMSRLIKMAAMQAPKHGMSRFFGSFSKMSRQNEPTGSF
jgi:hypothetical protein